MPADLTRRAVENEISRQTGRHYAIRLDMLDDRSLDELLRLLRDLDNEKKGAVQRDRRMWPRRTCE